MLIVFFGPDGAGKTTIARLLIHYLKKRGYHVVYIKMRAHHLFMYLLIHILQLLNVIPETHSPRILHYSLRRVFGKSRLYPWLEVINVVLWYILHTIIYRLRGYIIVADRFSPDTFVSISLVNSKINKTIKRILLSLCTGCVAVYIFSHPQILLYRKQDENLSLNYLKYELILYNNIFRELAKVTKSIIIINTTKLSPTTSLAKILQRIFIG